MHCRARYHFDKFKSVYVLFPYLLPMAPDLYGEVSQSCRDCTVGYLVGCAQIHYSRRCGSSAYCSGVLVLFYLQGVGDLGSWSPRRRVKMARPGHFKPAAGPPRPPHPPHPPHHPSTHPNHPTNPSHQHPCCFDTLASIHWPPPGHSCFKPIRIAMLCRLCSSGQNCSSLML